MKILELTNYSAGICGVWQRVKQESIELSKKNYKVKIFTSNAIKGSTEIASENENLQNIKIQRFPFKKLGGESFMDWSFEKQALKFNPEIIIAHSYRHPHTLKALKIKKKLKKQGKKCKVFLVTHAPFIEKNTTRSFFGAIMVTLYDLFIGRRRINQFDKIITITKWEEPYLKKLGVKKGKIKYLPNGIPEEFFKIKTKKGKNILFFGRISPIKDLEVLIMAMKKINIQLEIVGPAEKKYKERLLKLIKKLKLSNIHFKGPIYNLKEKIYLIDDYDLFVLPSKREAMPQSLIEAMAREKICIASNNPGSKEIIINNKNGFLFDVGDDKELLRIFKKIQKMSQEQKNSIKKMARKTSEKFEESVLIKELESLFL